MISIYVHIPFCKRRCSYCDFITFANKEELISSYINALLLEIELSKSKHLVEEKIKSVYFGGGTPSYLPFTYIINILSKLKYEYDMKDCKEITFEANPNSVSLQNMQSLREIGVNRISLGVQSFIEKELSILNRIHNIQDIYSATQVIRDAGFRNLNIDLIFGIPGQTLRNWEFNLKEALALEPEHLSLYALSLTPETRMAEMIKKREIPDINDDLMADMYEFSKKLLTRKSYFHYEISNWAKNPEYKSIHNLQYWMNLPYLGFGVGAHSYYNNFRTKNIDFLEGYIERVNSYYQGERGLKFAAMSSQIYVEKLTEMKDTMLLGLRLIHEGISEKRFFEKHGVEMKRMFSVQIKGLVDKGLLEWVKKDDGQHIRLTSKGILISNQVFMEFV